MRGTTQGVEASVNWKVTHRWTLSPGYSFLKMNLHTEATSLDTTSVADTQGSNPNHLAQIRSHMELPRGFSLDANAYFVERLPAQFIPSYTRLDTQLTWKLAEREVESCGSELAQGSSRGVQQSNPERQFITGQARRLCEAHLAILIPEPML